MKRLLLFIALGTLLFFRAPSPTFAAATCAVTDCACRVAETDWYSDSTKITTAASCIEYCKKFVVTGTLNWYFVCTETDGNVSSDSGTVDRNEGTTVGEVTKSNPVIPVLNVPIPGLDFGSTVTYDSEGNLEANFLGKYIDALYKFLIVAMTIVAIVMLMIGGFQYILSRGNPDAVKKARERMTNAVIGLVLLMAAFNIAFLINPDTVQFSTLKIKTIPYESIPEELEEDMATYGETGSVDASSVAEIPSDANEHHIVVNTTETNMADEVYTALSAAAEAFYSKTESLGRPLNVRLTSASRTVQKQSELFYDNCVANGYCSPDTCNPDRGDDTVIAKVGGKWTVQDPYAGTGRTLIVAAMVGHGLATRCMHTNNVAVDVWPEKVAQNYTFDVDMQNLLTTTMIDNGFCRIPNEPWHFELADKASAKCSTSYNTSDYVRSGKSYSTSSCKTWKYKSNCCAIAKNSSSPPSTMCK